MEVCSLRENCISFDNYLSFLNYYIFSIVKVLHPNSASACLGVTLSPSRIMFILTVSSLLFSSMALQAAAHGNHDHNEDNFDIAGNSIVTRGHVQFELTLFVLTLKLLTSSRMRNFRRMYNINCPSRSADDLALITQELDTATAMANYAQANLLSPTAASYISAFIPADIFSDALNQLETAYSKPAVMNDQADPSYKYTVTCDDTHPFCVRGYTAAMDDSKSTMNLCSAFFDITGTPAAKKVGMKNLATTGEIIAGCTGDTPTYNTLWDIWFGKAQMLLHELTHTTFFTGSSEKTRDYAYAPTQCQSLAAGTRRMPESREWISKKRGIAMCPDKANGGQPGLCDPNFSIENADTLSIIAGAMWFSDSDRCNKVFPIGSDPTQSPPSAKLNRQVADVEIDFEPPYDGFGYDSSACATPDANGCCGECTLPSSTAVSASSSVASGTVSPCGTSSGQAPCPTPDCGTHLGEAPCSTQSTTSSIDWDTTVSVSLSSTTQAASPTIGGGSSATTSPLQIIATGCADPDNVEGCAESENSNRPSCTTADDCDAPCRIQLANNSAALQYGYASTCIDQAYCTCSVATAEVVGQILIDIGDVVCAVWNKAIPAAIGILQFVVPYVGELAEGAELGEFFEAADQVLKKGSKDCNIACNEIASGQKFTAVDPLDNSTWANILSCDDDSVPPS